MGDSSCVEFDAWLSETLIKLNSDDEVFSPYIKGILDTDDPIEEKTEAIEGILSSITEDGIDQLCADILSKWTSWSTVAATPPPTASCAAAGASGSSLDDKLLQLMGNQSLQLATAPAKQVNTTEKTALKNAILAQYAQVSGDEDEDEGPSEGPGKAGAVGGVAKNNNAAAVDQEVKMKREQSKLEHKIKKDKDKEDREKQKSKVEERKDKEKKRTQKGERRR